MRLLNRKEKTGKEAAARKTEKKAGKKVKKKIVFGCIAVVLALAVSGAVAIGSKNDVMKIPAATAATGDVETLVSTSGVVESEISKIYYAPMAAKISEVTVEQGDAVKKGTVLLSYDTDDLEYKKKQDELEAQASENSYLSSIAESDKQEKKFNESTQALADIDSMIHAEKDFINQLKNYIEDEKTKKKLELYDKKYRINRRLNALDVQMYIEETEGVHTSQTQARNELSEVEKKLEELECNKELTEIERTIVKEQEKLADMEEYRSDLKSDKSSAEGQILNGYKKKELEAQAQKSKISEEQAQAHLEEALQGVTVEFNGIVTELDAREGFVTEAGSKLMKVESSDDVRVTISLSKYDLAKVALGQKAEVTISGKVYDGIVSKINRMAEKNDSGSRLVTAQVHVENPDENVYLGIEGKVVIHAQKSENTLIVPVSAVNTDWDGDFCMVIRNGIVEKQAIKAGLSSESSIEILEGLQEGDVVLTDTTNAQEGMAAEPLLAETGTEEKGAE